MEIKTLFIIIVILFVSICQADDSVALTIKAKGKIELTRGEENSKLNTGDELYNKDELESMEDSFAAFKFIDGSSIVKLFPNSILTINAQKDGDKLNKKSYLKMGELWSKVVKKTGVFEVETPTTVVSVKGTEILISHSNEKGTILYTFSGEAEIKNKRDGKTAIVGADQKAHLTPDGLIEVSGIQKGDIDKGVQQMMEEEGSSENIEIELKNDSGEKKTITIEFE